MSVNPFDEIISRIEALEEAQRQKFQSIESALCNISHAVITPQAKQITIAEAAAKDPAGRALITWRGYVRRGQIASAKSGRRILIQVDDYEKFINTDEFSHEQVKSNVAKHLSNFKK